jgi:apolipoprotein N-acyltransferase
MRHENQPAEGSFMATQSVPQKAVLRGQASARAQAKLPPAVAVRAPWLALVTGAILWMCHFPLAWGWLAWVALVPLLSLVRMHVSAGKACLFAWLAGLLYFVPAIQWMRVADYRMYATWLGLALYCSMLIPAGIALVRYLDRKTGWPLVLTFPAVWTALEYFRAFFGGGFPWYFLGYTQHDFLPVIQIADLAGVFGVSFLVAAVNVIAFAWLARGRWFRTLFAQPDIKPGGAKGLVFQSAGVVAALAGTLTYGFWRLDQNDFTPGPRLALVQGSLDQRVRNDASDLGVEEAIRTVAHHFQSLSDQSAYQHPRPDLIVWPETSYPGAWIEPAPARPNDNSREMARLIADRCRTNSLIGLNAYVTGADGRERRYNSALLVEADGQAGLRYDKIHRVPFGEYVPFKDWLPFMNRFAPYDFDYSVQAGETYTRFPLGTLHFGVLICYEDTDPYLARQYVRRDNGLPPADFLVNISNDGWFNGTSEHEEHLAICRFRAVESRRAVARAVNMGISAVIDGNGRVLEPTTAKTHGFPSDAPVWEVNPSLGRPADLAVAHWARFKKVAGVLMGTIPLDHRFSLYAQCGDWLPWLCWLLIGLGIAWSLKACLTRLITRIRYEVWS